MSVNTDAYLEGKQQESPKSEISQFLGQGTYGIIIGQPRLPSEGETHAEVIASLSAANQVSKVIKDTDDLDKLNWIVDIIHERFNPSNLAQLQTQIVIPSRPQLINWRSVANAPLGQIEFLKSHKITKRRTKWHYLMERGTADLDTELRAVKSVNQLKHFLKAFGNIINGLTALHSAGLAHTDIKLTNMIVSWDGRYKLIDLDELSNINVIPSNKYQFEKIYNNVYYPYYPVVGVFLWVLSRPTEMKITDKVVDMLITDLVKKNYDKDYYKYYIEISKATLQTANDPALTQILQSQYVNSQGMQNYLVDFSKKLVAQPDRVSALRELLLFIDRYAIGINLVILLGKYYKITGQLSYSSSSLHQIDTNICPFISQSLISLIKLCCNIENYGRITTQQIADEYHEFIAQLFRSYPFKFIIKLLSGLVIRRRSSQV
jgi:serine/threonine protein kinase